MKPVMVNDLAVNDLYEIRKLSPLSDFDKKVVIDLYMPLAGSKAIALYFVLFEMDDVKSANHEKLLRNTGLSIGEMVASLNALEALSLVNTYLGEGPNYRLFSYCLFAPHSPRTFFDDPLFAGTLSKYIGEEDTKKLAKKYTCDEKPNGYKNVSMDFLRYFAPDLNDEKYVKSVLSSGGKKTGKTKLDFDFEAFLKALRGIDSRYGPYSLSQEEINYLSRLKALYGYSEETLAYFVNSSFSFYEPIGKRLNKEEINRLCKENIRFDYLKIAAKEERKANILVKGESGFAKTVRRMQTESPMEFLSHLQKGNKLASGDVSLIEELTMDMGLNAETTNALLLYVLLQKDNRLPKSYATKVAASLMREGIETAIDAMNYFSIGNKKKAKTTIAQTPPVKNEDVASKEPTTSLSIDKTDEADDDFDDIFADIRKNK